MRKVKAILNHPDFVGAATGILIVAFILLTCGLGMEIVKLFYNL